MKGAAFLKPLEWQIDIEGESWPQGAPIAGVLRARNTSADVVPLTGGVQLAVAEMKKVHTRDEKAFKPEAEVAWTQTSLAPGAEAQLPFSFTLPANCPVTDKKASFYAAYGPTFKEANLQLTVLPRKIFLEVTRLLETFLRFKPKDVKATKGAVEFKLIPPTSRDFAHVEALHLALSVDGDQLQLDFLFKVKTLDAQSVTTKVAKDEKLVTKRLTPREYLLGRDMLNQDGVLRALEDVLAGVRMKGL